MPRSAAAIASISTRPGCPVGNLRRPSDQPSRCVLGTMGGPETPARSGQVARITDRAQELSLYRKRAARARATHDSLEQGVRVSVGGLDRADLAQVEHQRGSAAR